MATASAPSIASQLITTPRSRFLGTPRGISGFALANKRRPCITVKATILPEKVKGLRNSKVLNNLLSLDI
jgi:hypothetical protein